MLFPCTKSHLSHAEKPHKRPQGCISWWWQFGLLPANPIMFWKIPSNMSFIDSGWWIVIHCRGVAMSSWKRSCCRSGESKFTTPGDLLVHQCSPSGTWKKLTYPRSTFWIWIRYQNVQSSFWYIWALKSFIEQFVVGEVHRFFLIDTFTLKGRIIWILRDLQRPQVCFLRKASCRVVDFAALGSIIIRANWGCIILQLSTWATLKGFFKPWLPHLAGIFHGSNGLFF